MIGELASGLALPWSVVALPDGSALVSERDTAEIKVIRNGATRVVGVVPGVAPAGEGGLLGLALSPGFATDRLLYAYCTSPDDNRVVRMRYSPDGTLGAPEPILTGIPKGAIHNGGRLKFGPDGFLYIGTGEGGDGGRSQDRSSLGGKILRVTADGKPAPGNPFPGSPVYSLGHRNVQGLDWDASGRLWASEFGPTVDDELNLIVPGGNYGWPEVTGAPHRAGFIDARAVWPSTADASPSGMAIVNGFAYLGALRGERLWQVPLHGQDAGTPVEYFRGQYGRLRDVEAADGGEIWVVTNEPGNARILRMSVK